MKRPPAYLLLLLLFAVVISVASTGGNDYLHRFWMSTRQPRDVNIILIVVDALRADHLSCYGYSQQTSPHIDELAKKGILFEHTFAPLPMTDPSFATLFTSLFPQSHGITHNSYALSPRAETIAEIFQHRGWQTAAFAGAANLDSVFNLDQGFQLYDDDLGRQVNPQIRNTFTMKPWERRAEEMNRLVFDYLDHKRKPGKFFLMIHYYDPHKPYHPPGAVIQETSEDEQNENSGLYDGEISYTDQEIGLLWKKLEAMNLTHNTLMIITGDHGEALGEHGWQGHRWQIYDEAMHIPMIFIGPDIPAGRRYAGLMMNIDVAPTLMEYLHLPRPRYYQGYSFMPAFHSDDRIRDLVLMQKASPPDQRKYERTWRRFPIVQWGVRTETEKFIWSSDKNHQFYDLVKDPGEHTNLFHTEHDRAMALFEKGFEYKTKFPAMHLAIPPTRKSGDNDPTEVLKALGYLN